MAQPPPRTNLSDLVHAYRTDNGINLDAFAKACVLPDGDSTLSRSWINQLENNTFNEIPKPMRLEALATGMDMDPREVTIVAIEQWLGIRAIVRPHPTKPGQKVKVILSIEGLSDDEIDKVVADSVASVALDAP
ncbi:helix-turn-helix domain-containing protein [Streptacidiphilus carbonis]|uniref:helix-turn-helix domain-containing protein n=1 Tax=Streptacidiphilus carbonis TaxID=105422 RepID=UPI0005A7FB10|nr:helix-turn-helix domain-containing protein [Streptacidiphilus carbonis]